MPTTPLFIAGTFTCAQVLANYSAPNFAGQAVLTTDMGTLLSDGTRWLALNPPTPPGATAFGYNKNLYTVIPTQAEIGFSNVNAAARLYSGWGPYGSQPDATAYSTSNGQLQMLYQGNGAQNGVLTTLPFANSRHLAANYGQVPFILAGRGFHYETALTMSSNNTDLFNAAFLLPQEHNTIQDDTNGAIPITKYEQWHEFDVNESGHGTDYAGAYRGSYIQWSGESGGVFALSTAPSQFATSITLSTPWAGETATAGHPWTIRLSTGETHTAILVNGSAGPYTISAVANVGNSTAITIGYTALISSAITNTAPLDYTAEHIFGLTYDPIGQNVYSWQDGVLTGSTTTQNANSSNTFRDSLHYFPIFQMASRGAFVLSTMNIRYFSAWIP